MMVESGALIAKVVDFRQVLVRVDIPLKAAPPKTLKLYVLPPTPPAFEGPANRSEPPEPGPGAPAELTGVAAQVDPALQATGYLYKLDQTAEEAPGGLATNLWRPGLFVKAYLDVNAAKPFSGLAVPRSALLFHQGRVWIYVELRQKLQPGQKPQAREYKRVEVNVLGREGNTWIVTADDLNSGDLLVTEGALFMLSEEFRQEADND
jgi:multidrug efflux pump subunit AcrA (membrane-fusion protein)